MILLRFTVRNHKSIRDEITLSFLRPGMKSLTRPAGDWAEATFQIGTLFGPNASGKTAVLDALHYTSAAVRESSRDWLSRSSMMRAPFMLTEAGRSQSSRYELEFALGGVRHEYAFEVDKEGILAERLRQVGSRRWRTLFSRQRGQQLKLGTGVSPIGPLSPRELVLSRALVIDHPQLGDVAHAIGTRIDVVRVGDDHRTYRLSAITDGLAEGRLSEDEIVRILQIADVGIEAVDVSVAELPEHVREVFEAIRSRATKGKAENAEAREDDDAPPSLDDDEWQMVLRSLTFAHRGADEDAPPFREMLESSGTIAWMAAALPAVEALRDGSVFAIDEIDASLHPHLVQLLLDWFDDPAINVHGAQLLCTSHNPFILSPLCDIELDPRQVWFTDKTAEGVTTLRNLDDFPRHRDANIAKRYLEGRYGGTPRLAESLVLGMLER